MSKEKTLAKNTIIYLIGNFGSKFLSILIIPLYTNFLRADDYGYYDLIFTYITLLMPVVTLQLSDAIYRYLLDSKTERERSSILTNSLSVIFRNLLFADLIAVFVYQFYRFDYQYLFLIQFNFTIIYNIWLQIARGFQKNLLYSISGIIYTAVSLTLNVITIVIFKLAVGGLIISNIVAALVAFFFIEIKIRALQRLNIKLLDKASKKKLLIFSIPLIPNVISWWVMNVSDRTMLNYYIGMEANGIYAIANKFPSIMFLLNTIFSLAWQESVITEKENKEFYSRMFNLYVKLQFTGAIVFLAITKILMDILVGENFDETWKYVPFLYIATIFSGFSSFYGASYLSSEKTVGAFYSSVVGAIVNIVVNLWLIPIIGIHGAAISTFFAFLVMWIMRLVDTRKFFEVQVNWKDFAILSVIAAVYTALYYVENMFVQVILIFISLIIFFAYNRDFLQKVLITVLKKVKISGKQNRLVGK